MAKKKKSFKLNLGTIISLGAAVLALVALCMMFAPAAVGKDTDVSYTGVQMAFGYTATADALVTTVSKQVLNFSVNFLTYALLLVGVVFTVLAMFGVLGNISKIVATVCYIAAGVFFFCTVAFCSPTVEVLTGDAAAKYVSDFKNALTLGVGAIMGGILSILAALATAATLFIKK